MEANENGVVFSGYIGEIENTQEAIRKYLGGFPEVIHLTEDLNLVGKEESGKRLPMNRAMVIDGKIDRILFGNLLGLRQDENGFCSIKETDIPIFKKYLRPVFYFDGKIMIPTEESV